MPEPLSSYTLDLAIREQISRHSPPEDGDGHCIACGDVWPCALVIWASISLKLSAIANILQGDANTISLVRGMQDGAQGNANRR